MHEITRSRSHSAPTAFTPQPLTPLMPHLRNETFYFDTVEEGEEFRAAAAALKHKYHPEPCVPPSRHVTQEDLHGFARLLSKEIVKMRCAATIKECYLRVERLSNVSRFVSSSSSKLHDKCLRKQMLYHTDFSRNTTL